VKSPEAAIRTLLISAGIFGSRVYPIIAPTSAGYPFAVYRRTNVERESTFVGPMGSPKVSIDLTVLSDTYESARTASDAAREELDMWSGQVDDVFINNVAVTNESDDFVQLTGTELPPSYSVTLSLDVLWSEKE